MARFQAESITTSANKNSRVKRTVRHDPEHVIQVFSQIPNAEFIARTLGEFDIIVTLLLESPRKLVDLLEELDKLDTIISREIWMHMSIEFERYQRTIDAEQPLA